MNALVSEARAALRAGDAVRARQVLGLVPAGSASAEVVEALAQVAYLELNFFQAIETWERAYGLFRATGDRMGAVRVARTLAPMYLLIVGDRAVGSGWLARSQTLLGEAGESPERGWVALNVAMFESDRLRKEELLRMALGVARQVGDSDLELVVLAYLGASLVHGDRIEEGMLLLDEALAAVAGGEVSDFLTLEEIFCQLFSACEHAHDVGRAEQWIRIGEGIAERRKLPAVSAFCRTHYGAVLTAAGRWPEAEVTLTEAVRLWGLGQRSTLRQGALVRLADLRARQGRYEEAEQLLAGVDAETEIGAAHPWGAIHLARGETALAGDILERALARIEPLSTPAGPLLALLVDVHLAAGRLEEAEQAALRLDACCSQHPGDHYLEAVAALARGRICLAAGSGEPQRCLRQALTGFAQAQMPVELARARLVLAHALVADRPEVALAEARAALEAFESLQAARDVDAAAAILRTLGVRPVPPRAGKGPLTKREGEVLDLLGLGLSNPEISERLYISRKTVEHHVGNILAKLGLRSRAEAAAYAARAKPGSK
jgi:DNA-binding CsgD family transcriptional regulator